VTQTPHTPAGWYPVEGGERWWDGTAWSEHHRPTPPAPPVGYPAAPGAPYAGQVQQQQAPNHTTRNVLIVIAVLFVLLLGGCLAVAGVFVSSVDDAIEETTANDREPGGPDNPVTIEVGQAFEVAGFEYAEGWTVTSTSFDTLQVENFRVTNNRTEADDAFVELTFLQGTEALATADCIEVSIPVGQTVTLDCVSGDPLPAAYDRVTVNDAF